MAAQIELHNWNLTQVIRPAQHVEAHSVEQVQEVLRNSKAYPSPVSAGRCEHVLLKLHYNVAPVGSWCCEGFQNLRSFSAPRLLTKGVWCPVLMHRCWQWARYTQ